MTYNTSSFRPSLPAHYPPSTRRPRSPPMVILGYKERDPDGRPLCGMLESKVGIHLEKVGGWQKGTPVEFLMGRVKPPPFSVWICSPATRASLEKKIQVKTPVLKRLVGDTLQHST